MTQIRAINYAETMPISTPNRISKKMSVFYVLALLNGKTAGLSMETKEKRRQEIKAANITQGIVEHVQRHQPKDSKDVSFLDKMLADIEKMKAIFSGESVQVDAALAKLDAMSANIGDIKGKLLEANKKHEDAIKEYNSEAKELTRLGKKLKEVEEELSKYFWVPFYGGKLAVEVLVLQGRVKSAMQKVEGKVKEVALAKQEIMAVIKKLEATLTPMEEIKKEAQTLFYHAKGEMASLQEKIDSALDSYKLISGGV